MLTKLLREETLVCKNICLNIFILIGFLEDVAITLIAKTDGRYPKPGGKSWMRILKTLAPDELNIEGCV